MMVFAYGFGHLALPTESWMQSALSMIWDAREGV